MLEGRVAVVTGAARGLGRAEALALAAKGARVVVNDLGVDLSGQGSDARPADELVREIAERGGEAAAHHGDVADWDSSRRLVEFAIERFGGLDILVNNAGFIRDRMIFNMSAEEWDAVIRVHLRGHFCTSHWATAHWRERSKAEGGPIYGRVINTASDAFLLGSPGQPNYAAAKAGIAALTMSIAQSCLRYGVTANAICPRARTRMTEATVGEVFKKPEQGFDTFAPENVTPLVVSLASPGAARVSGQVFIVYGGNVSLLAPPRVVERFESEGAWEPEALAEALEAYFEKKEPVQDGFVMKFE